MPTMHMSKVPEYPRPHDYQLSWSHGLESAVVNDYTILPIIVYDEGLGVISSYKSNPGNASFAEYAGANCYPTSRVNNFFCEISFSLSKLAIETDKVQNLRFSTMQIFTSFDEGKQALDETSTLDIHEILELSSEATDRQTIPLYNTVKMKDGKSNAFLNMPADQAGLDTDLEIEGIAWQETKFYDCLHYYTNGHKMKSMVSGLKWHTLTRNKPQITMRFHQNPKTKAINPYTFHGIHIGVPGNDSLAQHYTNPADTTDIAHMQVIAKYRYNEWNHEFNHDLQ